MGLNVPAHEVDYHHIAYRIGEHTSRARGPAGTCYPCNRPDPVMTVNVRVVLGVSGQRGCGMPYVSAYATAAVAEMRASAIATMSRVFNAGPNWNKSWLIDRWFIPSGLPKYYFILEDSAMILWASSTLSRC